MPIIGSEASTRLRDRLMAEVRELDSSAIGSVPPKMVAARAHDALEEAFQARLEAIGVDGADPPQAPEDKKRPPAGPTGYSLRRTD